jgi:tetratricopeptide (TPR) repeat protein
MMAFSLVIGCGRPISYISEFEYYENQEAMMQFETALASKAAGDYEAAIVEFQHYLDYYGDLYRGDEAMFEIAQCYEALKQWNEAINQYRLLIKKYRPTFFRRAKGSRLIPESMYRIGECYRMGERWREAVKAYIEVVKKHFDTRWAKESIKSATQLIKEHPKSKWGAKMDGKLKKIIAKMEKK